jgi:hypothetical protein
LKLIQLILKKLTIGLIKSSPPISSEKTKEALAEATLLVVSQRKFVATLLVRNKLRSIPIKELRGETTSHNKEWSPPMFLHSLQLVLTTNAITVRN